MLVSTAEAERYHARQQELPEAERHETLEASMHGLLLSLYVSESTGVKPGLADLGALRVVRGEEQTWRGNYVLLRPAPEESRLCLRKHRMGYARGPVEVPLPSRLVTDLEASLRQHVRRYVFVSPASNGPLDEQEYAKLEQSALQRAAPDSGGGAEPMLPLGERRLVLVWRCEEAGCCCELAAHELDMRAAHAQYHAALRGECGEDDDAEEAAPGLPAGYLEGIKRPEGCGTQHMDGKSCARPYVCEHAPDVRGDGTKRLVPFKGEVETKFSCCPVEGCRARSRTEAAMRRHLEVHHAGELLCKCEDCGQAFRTCGKLLEHVRRTEHFFEMADPRGYLGDEVRVGSVLRREGVKFCWQKDVWLTPQPGVAHDARVDFTLDTPSGGVICLEVDDNAHRRCKVQKELDRMREVAAVMGKSGTRPVTFVRYNVDPFTLNKITKLNPAKEKREARLLEELKKAEAYTRPLSVVYMFYDVYYDEAERRMLPSVMKREGYPDEMKANCVGVVFNAGV